MSFLWVALGGAVGSSARYGVNLVAPRLFGENFPWATLIVNIIGSFIMGCLIASFRGKFNADENLRLFLTTGLLGGFTTFSAFSIDTLVLAQKGQVPLALIYGLASVALSIIAVAVGYRAFS